MLVVAGPLNVPLMLLTTVKVSVTVELAAIELVGVETSVDLDPFAKVMVVVANSLLAVRVVMEVTLAATTTSIWQPTGSNGVVLLFTIVKMQTPLAREHDAFCPDTDPSNDGPPSSMTGAIVLLVLTVVEL
jgi:hypothetical protein